MDERRLGEGGRYELRTQLGAGAIGIVTLAYDHRMMRFVAVKELSQTFARNPKIRARFRNEALIQGDIVHENVVRALDVIEEGDTLAIVMDFIDGTDVEGMLEQAGGQLSWAVAKSVMPPIFAGVAAAHRKGIVHRDLKPGNILIDRSSGKEVPRVTDFGIAKIVGSAEGLTREGAVLGTPSYMSPEQLKGVADLDARTDIYALGAIVYRALCGGPPHAGTSEYDITHKVLSKEQVVPPSSVVPGLPAGLDGWVAKAMAFDRNDRFESVDAMAAEFLTVETTASAPAPKLAPTVAAAPVAAAEAPAPARLEAVPPAARSGRAKGYLVAAAVATLAVGGFVAWRVMRPATTAAPVGVPTSPAAVEAAPAATPPASPPTATVLPVTAAPVAAAPVAALPAPTAAATVAITVHPNVGGVLLQVVGQEVAYPLPDNGADKVISFARSTTALVVTARKPGYRTESYPVIPSQDGRLDVVLRAEPSPAVVAAQPSYVPPAAPAPAPQANGPTAANWRFTTVVMGSRAGNGIGVNGFYEMDVPGGFSAVSIHKTGFSTGRNRTAVSQRGVAVPTWIGSVAGRAAYSMEVSLLRGAPMWFVFVEASDSSLRGFWRQTGMEWERTGFYGILEGHPRTDFERELSRNDPRVCFQDCAVNSGIAKDDLAALGRACVAQCGP